MSLERLLDVSELEAPEPLLQAIAALEALPRGDYLRFRHRMKPCHLFELLEQNQLAWEMRQGDVVECELFIWHRNDTVAEADARRLAETLRPWQE